MVLIALAEVSLEPGIMYRDSERLKTFSRRSLILFGGKAALVSILVGRMYYLQVVEADKYRTLSDENRINLRLLPPRRGEIVDRFGRPLADNQQNYRVLLISENTRDVDYTIDMLSQIIEISPGEIVYKRILFSIAFACFSTHCCYFARRELAGCRTLPPASSVEIFQ